jgi:hypothetical protein
LVPKVVPVVRSVNVTDPTFPGVPPPGMITVAVKVTEIPSGLGLGKDCNVVAVVDSTSCEYAVADVLGTKLESPLYVVVIE